MSMGAELFDHRSRRIGAIASRRTLLAVPPV
jgi:hypothetical protein